MFIKAPYGVSVVICCHNSEQRIAQTLNHLAAQQVPTRKPWEVVIVDNASSDKTAQLAHTIWSQDPPAPLRVVDEPKRGLAFARQRGFQAARFEFVSFVDDDNWVAKDWVEGVYEIMSSSSDIGACGGVSRAVCETEPPTWFRQVQSKYAIGRQGDVAGDITWSRGYLWGAGLTVRKSAWERLVSRGFRPLLVGRQGRTLGSGEDQELCLALRLAGWQLCFEPRLRLSHFIPTHRLRWRYLRRMMRGFGASSVEHDPYRHVLPDNSDGLEARHGSIWLRKTGSVIKKLLRYKGRLLISWWMAMEGDGNVLAIEYLVGRLGELVRRRESYDRSFQQISEASWRDPLLKIREGDRNALPQSP